MSAVVAGQVRVARVAESRVGELVEERERDAVLPAEIANPPEPDEHVLAAIPPRGAPAAPGREHHPPPGVVQLLGQLDACLTGSDDQDAARWERPPRSGTRARGRDWTRFES